MTKYLFVLFFTVSNVFAQVQDANLWLAVGLKANVTKKFNLEYETQTRFDQNYSTLSKYYNELSAAYTLPLNFATGVSYRYSRKNKSSHYIGENRVCLNLEYSFKITPLNLKFKTRARYQHAFDRLRPVNDIIYPLDQSSFRLKFNLQYTHPHPTFKKISPYVSGELFKNIAPASEREGLDGIRLTGGIKFDLPAKQELDLCYIMDKEYDNKIKIAHVISLQYTYKISHKSFKKKKKKGKK